MKSKLAYLCLISIETVAALYFAAGAAASYGRAVPLTCLKSRLSPMVPPCVTPSARPMPRTSRSRTLSARSTARGWATYYTTQSCQREGTSGVLTASGRKYDENSMTCALWITNKHGKPLRPDGRLVKISRVGSSRTLTVAWQDNGPGRVQRLRGVVCDLTPAAFKALGGNLRDGKIAVTVEAI